MNVCVVISVNCEWSQFWISTLQTCVYRASVWICICLYDMYFRGRNMSKKPQSCLVASCVVASDLCLLHNVTLSHHTRQLHAAAKLHVKSLSLGAPDRSQPLPSPHMSLNIKETHSFFFSSGINYLCIHTQINDDRLYFKPTAFTSLAKPA